MIKRKNKKDINDSLSFVKSFCENRITFKEFWDTYTNNNCIREMLLYDLSNFHLYTFRDYIVDINHIKSIDVSKLEIRLTIFRFLKNYLKSKDIEFCPFSPDEEMYSSICGIVPKWLKGQDLSYILELSNFDVDKHNINAIDELKRKIVDSFIYVNEPPKWLQSSEWPILKSGPMIFCGQSDDPDNPDFDGSSITYLFISNDKKVKREVIQFD